ncbi:MAG: hypothetical protein RIR33_1174 [Pseudomonadota bacterium]|jgi:hypothetical protein
MQYLEQIERGLPSKDFVLPPANPAGSRTGIASSPARRQIRLRPDSPWRDNLEAAQGLTWRGRNFIDAFADVNHYELVQASMIELAPGQCIATPNSWSRVLPSIRHYHLVCRASEGASIEVGDEAVALHTGDLWRVDGSVYPPTVCAGNEGGLYLVLALARRDTRQAHHEFFDTQRINLPGGRSQSVGQSRPRGFFQ